MTGSPGVRRSPPAELASIDPSARSGHVRSGEAGGRVGVAWAAGPCDPDQVVAFRVGRATALYAQRRMRNRFFDGLADLFHDPGWDMLLQLFLARAANRRLRTTSVCYAGHVPVSTGLRWLTLLEERGLVTSETDPFDRRCRLVDLSDDGQRMMAAYLDQV